MPGIVLRAFANVFSSYGPQFDNRSYLSSSDLVLLRLLGVNLSGSGFMNRELVCKALERVIQSSDKRSELLVVFLVKMALAHGDKKSQSSERDLVAFFTFIEH